MTEDEYTIKTGHLDVGDGHKIYYQQWGNTDAHPVFVLHGGPIYHNKDSHKLDFDPKIHNVIFHDQRGCGLSEYSDRRRTNDTKNRVEDIEKLRIFFGFKTVHIYGYSFGSTLGLLYGGAYPERVSRMLLGGIFLSDKQDIDTLFQNSGNNGFPEAWEYYIEPVPEAYHQKTLDYYHEVLSEAGNPKALDHLRRFLQLESSSSVSDNDYLTFRQSIDAIDDTEELESALITIEWFQNNCYTSEGEVLHCADALKQKEIVIVHGRSDFSCAPSRALELKKRLGDSAFLQFVPKGHAKNGFLREVVRAHARHFLG